MIHTIQPPASRIAKLAAAAFAALSILAGAPSARAVDWYVAPAPFGNDSNSGTTDTLPFATIQMGINSSVNGDQVLLMDGTYTSFGNFNITFSGKAITVKSINGASAVIVDCEDISGRRGFLFQSVEPPAARLEGVTIMRGNAPVDPFQNAAAFGSGIFIYGGSLASAASPTIVDCVVADCNAVGGPFATLGPGQAYGAGIYMENSSATLSGCEIKYNHVVGGDGSPFMLGGAGAAGGGIYIKGGSPTISGCDIHHNVAEGGPGFGGGGSGFGGAVYIQNAAAPAISNCKIHLNTARGGLPGPRPAPGGGVYVTGGAGLTMTDSSLTSNTSEHGDLATAGGGGGGGICVYNNNLFTVTINRCLVSENVAGIVGGLGSGGGVFLENSLMQVTNTTVASNVAIRSGAKGAGIFVKSGAANLLNCTVAANQGIAGGGGGIRRDAGSAVLMNTLFVQNNPGGNLSASPGTIVSNGHNISSDNSYFLGGTGDLLNNSAHNLQPLASNGGPTLTRAILPPSSAIDSGEDVGAPFFDQRSFIRPEDGNGDSNPVTDIGAYEYVPPTPTPSPSPSETPSLTPSLTPTPTPTLTPSISPTPTATPVISSTPSISPSPTATISPTVSLTPTPNGAGDWEVYE